MYSIEPTSRPRVGWEAMTSLTSRRELAGDDHLLLVAARQVATSVTSIDGVRTSKSSTRLVGRVRGRRPSPSPRRFEIRLVVVGVEHHVLGDGEAASRARLAAGPRARARRRVRCTSRGVSSVTSSPADASPCPDSAGRRPVIASTSSVWPLPWTPGDADDLAGSDLEAERGSPRRGRGRRAPRGPLTSSTGSPGSACVLRHDELDRPADHQLGECSSVASAGVAVPTTLPAPQDRDPVGDLEDLVELVGDEDDRRARRRAARA